MSNMAKFRASIDSFWVVKFNKPGVKVSVKIDARLEIMNVYNNADPINRLNSFGLVTLYSMNNGIKTDMMALTAAPIKIAGTVIARKKASVIQLAPNIEAITANKTNPASWPIAFSTVNIIEFDIDLFMN